MEQVKPQQTISEAIEQRWWRQTAVTTPLLLFFAFRLLLILMGGAVVTLLPTPAEPNEVVRPYLGTPIYREGAKGVLLGPWQRFDTLRYLRIAREGYANEEDSVFPPVYPLLIRGAGALLGGGSPAQHVAALLISNVALVGLLLLLYRVTQAEIGEEHASRTLLYLLIFPAGFFLYAGYTESLFLLLTLSSLWAGKNGRFLLAGLLGYVAALTRLTGWILAVPLLYLVWQHYRAERQWWPFVWQTAVISLPGWGLLSFLGYRQWLGLPPIGQIYDRYWFQQTGWPGTDIWRALNSMLGNGTARAGEATLYFDFFCLLLLITTTWLAFRHLGGMWGLYSLMLLTFMLLPVSELKPLFSFSRYTLAFFPTFMLLGMAGKRPFAHRLILYPSLLFYLYFAAQFFWWGWVA